MDYMNLQACITTSHHTTPFHKPEGEEIWVTVHAVLALFRSFVKVSGPFCDQFTSD
jgi:hypothetical protein